MTRHTEGRDGAVPSDADDGGRGDELDVLLVRSAPAVGASTPERAAALAALVDASSRASAAGRSRLWRLPRAAAIGGAGALVIAGVGVAAAADLWTMPWASEPAAEVQYTRPSGTECAAIIGGFEGSGEQVAAAEEYLKGIDSVMATADVQATFEKMRSDPSAWQGPGAPPSQDELADPYYDQAVGLAISQLVSTELSRRGIQPDGLSVEWEAHCAEAGS